MVMAAAHHSDQRMIAREPRSSELTPELVIGLDEPHCA
jgi:hypothetical protein